MNVKASIEEALLPALRQLCPNAVRDDLLFFGEGGDLCSPLPLKYGIDIDADIVYNIKDTIAFKGVRLFSEAYVKEGYITFIVGPEALSALAEEASLAADTRLPEETEIGLNPEFIRAELLTAAFSAGETPFFAPEGTLAHRALWCCLCADSPSSRAVALRLADKALRENRRIRCLSRSAALAMAACFENK